VHVDHDGRSTRAVSPVVAAVLQVERTKELVELGPGVEHAPRAIGADPPQLRPVLVPMIHEQGHLWVRTHVVEPTERGRGLRLPVDRADDAISFQREAHRHEVRSQLMAHRCQPADARLSEATPHHGELHSGARYRSRVPPVAGLLLTGGASRRLGVAKATLLLDGERLVDRVARVLVGVAATVVEVGPGYTTLAAVREEPPGSGPLAALVAGAAALGARDDRARAALVLAVDLPFVDAPLLAWLASHPAPGTVVPVVDGVPQTLCARYSHDALAVAPDLVAAGERSMRALLDRVDVHEATEVEWRAVASARTFADVDTPEDATEFGLSAPG